MIKPYDLGKIVENTQSIRIDDLVRKSREEFKIQFIKSSFTLRGFGIQMTTTKTRFGGRRIWFVCPICGKKIGVIYLDSLFLGCRTCLGLNYRKQKFHNMIEGAILNHIS